MKGLVEDTYQTKPHEFKGKEEKGAQLFVVEEVEDLGGTPDAPKVLLEGFMMGERE